MSKKFYVLSLLSLLTLALNVNAEEVKGPKGKLADAEDKAVEMVDDVKDKTKEDWSKEKAKAKEEWAKKKEKAKEVEGYKVKYEEVDKDGKGYVTEEEYVKYHGEGWKKLAEVKVAYVTKDDVLEECKKEKDCNPKYKEKEYWMVDLNKDGKVTKEEYELTQKVGFAMKDKNGDGKVTKEEWEQKAHWKAKMDKKGDVKAKGKYKLEVKK